VLVVIGCKLLFLVPQKAIFQWNDMEAVQNERKDWKSLRQNKSIISVVVITAILFVYNTGMLFYGNMGRSTVQCEG